MDRALRLQILRASVRDRAFLKEAWRDVRPEIFTAREEAIVAKAAIDYYERYEEPIGPILRADVDDLVRDEKLDSESKVKLKELVDIVSSVKTETVSVKALIDRVKALKRHSFYESAVDEIITAQEQGKLTTQTLADLVDRANKELVKSSLISHDYFGELNKRMRQRAHTPDDDRPLLLIDPVDEKVRLIGRGHLGIFMAPPAGGKGLALIHTALAYAMQGLRVLHFTLEDPLRTVEDRLDSCLTGIPMERLKVLPNRLRRRFKLARKRISGRLHIIDGTDGGISVGTIMRIWEQEKQAGFEADAIIIDYDDELECDKVFKGESARRMEFSHIYRQLRMLAVKTNSIVWTAAQTTRASEGRKVITSRDTAEDFSKIRKVFLAISIGSDKENEDLKYLYFAKHRLGRSRFGVDILTDFHSAIFYDREATMKFRRAKQRMEK